MAELNLLYSLPDHLQQLIWRKYFTNHVLNELPNNREDNLFFSPLSERRLLRIWRRYFILTYVTSPIEFYPYDQGSFCEDDWNAFLDRILSRGYFHDDSEVCRAIADIISAEKMNSI